MKREDEFVPRETSTDVPISVPVSMTFSQALEAMKSGFVLTRAGWNGRHRVYLAHAAEHSEAGWFIISPEHGPRMPWLASQADLLADDWTVV